MRFCFGDVVVVEGYLVGVVVKSWVKFSAGCGEGNFHEVYVRSKRGIREYPEDQISRYMVRHKELSEEEREWNEVANG